MSCGALVKGAFENIVTLMLEAERKIEAIRNICDKLAERNADLFLGAGVNAGTLNNNGEEFPDAKRLSMEISRDLLGDESLNLSLDAIAEMARYKVGEEAFNKYLYEKTETFPPAHVHNTIVKLPWDVIYTTNYDLLIEKASKNSQAGTIQPVLSIKTDVTQFVENDILYYKLHGSIDRANTEDGRIIITKEDFRTYEKQRDKMFSRLKNDLMSRTFVFMGYSLSDSNFLAILDTCREELGIKKFPLSYVVKRSVSAVEKTFWKEKYNLEFIEDEAADFIDDLAHAWKNGGYEIESFDDRKKKRYFEIDDTARFPKFAHSYYRLVPSDCTGASNPERFYKGGEPLWADVRDKIFAPRDAYDELFEVIFPELSDIKRPASMHLVTGHAGTGKTTLVKALTYDLAKDFQIPIFIHIPGTPLDAQAFVSIADHEKSTRLILVINHAASYARIIKEFLSDCRRLNLSLTIILEERKNQWNAVRGDINKISSTINQVRLGDISDNEINRILDALTIHKQLGKLSGMTRAQQVVHFQNVSKKELLVALRELTLEQEFDEIIKDEFAEIPTSLAREAYLYVSALGQIDLPIRYETLIRILGISYADLTAIFSSTEGVLISGEEIGNARHNGGFNLSVRHPVIASVIFSLVAEDDEKKFDVINKILTNLDPGFPDDRKLLIDITRRRELVRTFVSPEKSRAVYERLSVILPGDPHVFQHWALLERELGEPERALEYAKRCLSLDHNDNFTFKNTYGFVLVSLATKSKEHKDRLILEADKIFSEEIRRDPEDAFGHLGKANILKLQIHDAKSSQERTVLITQLLSLLEEAYETTFEAPEIASELAEQKRISGNLDGAHTLLDRSLVENPADGRLRDALIRLQIAESDYPSALKTSAEGIKHDPTSWRLYRHIARCQRKLGFPPMGIKGNYEAAIRHNRSDLSLMVELGAFLFISGESGAANKIFNEANNMPMASRDKHRVLDWWLDTDSSRHMFEGEVLEAEGPHGMVMAIPENFSAFFFRTKELYKLRVGQKAKFNIGFSARGPIASILG